MHTLRHTAASNMCRAGIPLSTVQRIGGWKSYRILLERYRHVHLPELYEAMDKLEPAQNLDTSSTLSHKKQGLRAS
ncbi:MAG: tyrosine-type recombinase/integrase [bacterium]